MPLWQFIHIFTDGIFALLDFFNTGMAVLAFDTILAGMEPVRKFYRLLGAIANLQAKVLCPVIPLPYSK